MSEPILVALIGALGAAIAALIPIIFKKTPKETPPKKIAIFGWGLIGLVIGGIIGIPIAPLILGPPDPCLLAKIESPAGTHSKLDAVAFPVPNNVKISWVPSSCVMTVQYFQDQKLAGTYKNVVSGTEIKIGAPNSGETEIMIWREGHNKSVDNIWVWVKSELRSDNNLLENGNFETDISGGKWKWSDNIRVSRVAGNNDQGQGLCFSLRGVQKKEDWGILSQEISVESGQVYRFSGMLKWDNVKQFHIKMESNKVDWGPIPDEDWRNGTSREWVRRESEFKAPLNATSAKFVVLYKRDREGRPSSVCVDELVFAAQR